MSMSAFIEPRPRYFIDPEDPRAPPTHVWAAMTNEERRRVAEQLPSDFTLDFLPPPEGDLHTIPKDSAKDVLSRFFRRVGRPAYVASELAIYYPGERVFAPDVIAVLDVEPRIRSSWLVDKEGKGLDFTMEILVSGDPRKDMKKNVVRYASLGIPEYFVFDRRWETLHGFRLPDRDARVYEPIPSRTGRLESRVLGLDLTVEGGKVRFLVADSRLPEADDLLASLGAALDDAERRSSSLVQALEEAQKQREEEQKRREEEQKRREEEQRQREEAERHREEVEKKLADALAEIERLKRGG